MAMAAMVISAVAGLAGSFMQASALNAQADAQEKIAEFNARQKEIEANRRQAEGQLRGEIEERDAGRLRSKARAAGAQVGLDTTTGSSLLLDAELLKEGTFRKSLEIASAQNEQRSLQEGAKAERFEGKIRADASRSQARASLLGGIGSAFGSLSKISFG
jgi:hypothetical protein